MAEPIVISDDSEPEENPDNVVWRPPEVLEVSDVPQPAAATSEAEPSSSQDPERSSLVRGSSQVSPELNVLDVFGVDPAPRDRRVWEVASLSGSSDDQDVIVVTETDENPSKIRRVDRQSVNIAPADSGSGFEAEAAAPIPERQAGASVSPDQEPSTSQTPQGFFLPISSRGFAQNIPEQVSSSIFGRALSYNPASETVVISSASQSPVSTVPPMLEDFNQLFYESSEERSSDDRTPEPFRPAQVQIVINTIEANFSEATVQCLEEFVTPHYYPPREILAHVIRRILLAPNVGTLLNDTFKLLERIQELHPARVNHVEWDWDLLTFVMQTQDRELPGHIFFLRYVLRTLHDDFQEVLKLPDDQRRDTIASTVISCERQPQNIKDIIRWLMEILTDSAFPPLNIFPLTGPPPNRDEVLSLEPFGKDKSNQLIVLYMQKMLSMAIEVDNAPNFTSTTIAEMLFGHILTIQERNQRETFFISMENHLLRCKVLETLLLRSCNIRTTLPLCFGQILHFLNNATSLHRQVNDIGWDSWDELVEQLQFLLISYNQVLTKHLHVPIKERPACSRRLRLPRQHGDQITALDVELQIEEFHTRMAQVVSEPMPFPLQEKLFLLKLLFLQAIHERPLSGSRFRGEHLLKARNLSAQEFPELQ